MTRQRAHTLPARCNKTVLAALMAAMAGAPGWAQVTLPADADTSRLRAPAVPLPAPPRFELRIEAPEKSAVPKAVDGLQFDVSEIVVEGADHYPADEIKRGFAGLTGKRVGLDALRAAADVLEQRYRAEGFFLVRVFIPPQQVRDGQFRIRVVEGYLEAVSVEGVSDAARALVESLLKPLVGRKPIDLPSLERALLVLNDLPGVQGSGVLRPGSQLGASELVVSLAELPSASVSASVNNAASRVMGEYGVALNLTLNNPVAGWPGQLALGLNGAADGERLRALSARYAAPAGSRGLIASLGALVAQARPGGSLAPLDIESRSLSLSPRLRWPLLRGRGLSLYADGGLALNDSRTTIAGAELTSDRSSVADVGLAVVDAQRGAGRTELNLGVHRGLDALGAHDANTAAPSVQGFRQQFTKIRLSLSRLQSLPADWSLQFSLQSQWTRDKLLAGEQIFFGGPLLGRAYDGGAVLGDRGHGVLVELRKDMPALLPLPAGGRLQGFVFADYASAELLANPVAGTAYAQHWLSSQGVGLRYRDGSGLSVELQLADARRKIAAIDARADPRLLFLITKSFP